MPTFRHGRNTRLLFNQFELSSYFKDASVQQSADTPETTAFGSTNKSYVVGMTDGRVSLGGMFAGDVNGVDEVFASVYGLEAPLLYTYAPEGLAPGRTVWGMAAHTSSYGVSGSVADMVAVSVELQGTAGVRSGVSLSDPTTTVSVAGSGTVVDLGASSVDGGWALLHVLSNASTVASTFTVKHATTAGGTYTTVGTFTAVPGVTLTSQKLVIPAGTLNRYVRFGVAGSLDGAIGVHINLIRNPAAA